MYKLVFDIVDKGKAVSLDNKLEREFIGFNNCFNLFHDNDTKIREILDECRYFKDLLIIIKEEFYGLSRTIYTNLLPNTSTERYEEEIDFISIRLTEVFENHRLSYLIIEDQKYEKSPDI